MRLTIQAVAVSSLRAGVAALLLSVGLALPVSAQSFRSYVPVESGGSLEVRLASGSLEIETHDELEVSVDADARGLGGGAMNFELTSDGADARLVGERGGWLGVFGSGFVRVRVKIPERYSLDLRTGGGEIEIEGVDGWVQARTSGGNVEVDDVRGDVEVRTSGGRIRIDHVDGDVRAETSGGSIRIDEVDGSVYAKTSGGPIQVHEATGSVDARTSGGSVSVRFVDRAEGQLETSGGQIEVEFAEDAGVDLEAETSGGHVDVEHELPIRGTIARGRVSGQINGGGATLQLRTSGGNIRVRVR